MARTIIYLFIFIGSTLGSYLPVATMHVTYLSLYSIIGGGVGSVAGLWLGYKLYKDYLS